MTLGEKIREVRLSKRLTQKEVVGDFMTRNMLSKIENGSATPSVKTLEYLSGALGVPISYFMDNDNETGLVSELLSEHLNAIASIMDQLYNRADEPAQNPRYLKSVSICVKARVYMAQGQAHAAMELLSGIDLERFVGEGLNLLLKTFEDCHKELGDYKSAYEYAIRRTSAESGK